MLSSDFYFHEIHSYSVHQECNPTSLVFFFLLILVKFLFSISFARTVVLIYSRKKMFVMEMPGTVI
jgi:hypothetical protein